DELASRTTLIAPMRQLAFWVLLAVFMAMLRHWARPRNPDPVSGRRTPSRRNLPYMFLGLAILLGSMAIVIPLTGWLATAKESDLKLVAGSVQRAPGWVGHRSMIGIRVQTDDGVQELVEDDLSHSQRSEEHTS